MNQLILDLETADIYRHLSREETLLSMVTPGSQTLYLWRAADAVVVGRNQNPWCEVNGAALARHNVQLARRVSGGGTVFHDWGNLNFAFAIDRERYDIDRQLGIIIHGLGACGIRAQMGHRHELLVGDKKISGSAFRLRKGAALHHGTLLVNSDLHRLQRCLDARPVHIVTRAVASVRATVTNLTPINPTLTIEDAATAMGDAFREHCAPGSVVQIPFPTSTAAETARERYASWPWIYGETPRFSVDWPVVGDTAKRLVIAVSHGRVIRTSLCENACESEFTGFHSVRFCRDDLAKRLDQISLNEPFHNAMARWLATGPPFND